MAGERSGQLATTGVAADGGYTSAAVVVGMGRAWIVVGGMSTLGGAMGGGAASLGVGLPGMNESVTPNWRWATSLIFSGKALPNRAMAGRMTTQVNMTTARKTTVADEDGLNGDSFRTMRLSKSAVFSRMHTTHYGYSWESLPIIPSPAIDQQWQLGGSG
jgi:hypothetical protein